jgi:type IV pilus assembly protein PilA
MSRRSRRGFTIIEVVTVMVIIGILAAIALPKFAKTREKAYKGAVQADLRNLLAAQEFYVTRNMVYADAMSDLGLDTSRGVTVTITQSSGRGWAAVAEHSGLTGSCAIFFGTADAEAPATVAGTVECAFEEP